ncbi:MAG: hypothetical protein GY729_03280 [Desulfobacteraceae bacterium]|nr:hypothetical protein [Desulfobacteraceae bacterium]
MGSVRNEITTTIQDLVEYLSFEQKKNSLWFSLSKSSSDLMDQWDKPVASANFFFQGPDHARVFIVDSEGVFYKGEAGQLLTKILKAMGLGPDQVFICNAPDKDSIDLKLKQISPRVVVSLGQTATKMLLNAENGFDKLRGKFHPYGSAKVMPTFHPSRLIKDPSLKRAVWEDIKMVMAFLRR